jgi:ribosomal protein L37AE/L43A
VPFAVKKISKNPRIHCDWPRQSVWRYCWQSGFGVPLVTALPCRAGNFKKAEVEEVSVTRVIVKQCAQCRADIIAPEWSEHLSDCCIRHVWSCEACGYRFEDTVYLSRELADAS